MLKLLQLEYPTPMEDVNLTAMLTIERELGVKIGYSVKDILLVYGGLRHSEQRHTLKSL